MNETERHQMIKALYHALHHAYSYGGMAAVVLDGDRFAVDVQSTGDCIVSCDRVSDVGSPPRVWGRRDHDVVAGMNGRFTPTRVGKTR